MLIVANAVHIMLYILSDDRNLDCHINTNPPDFSSCMAPELFWWSFLCWSVELISHFYMHYPNKNFKRGDMEEIDQASIES